MSEQNPDVAKVDSNGHVPAQPLPAGVRLLHAFGRQSAELSCLAFDSHGKWLASGSRDKTIKLWDVASGKLHCLLGEHDNAVFSVVFDPQGGVLTSGGWDNRVNQWDVTNRKLLRCLEGHRDPVNSVAMDSQGHMFASASGDHTVKVWTMTSDRPRSSLEGHGSFVNSVAFHPHNLTLASGSDDTTVKLWETEKGKIIHTLKGHRRPVASVAYHPLGGTLASGSHDGTIKLWEATSGKLLYTLEGHTGSIHVIAFSPDGRLLASKSYDGTIRLWSCETWEMVAVIPEPTRVGWWIPALAFHPTLPLLAAAGSEPDTPNNERSRLIHLWELDYDLLLKQRDGLTAAPDVHHTTAKVVLVGDHSVGKSALGHRLIHGEFKEQASTHGQRFWPFPALGKRRSDGTQCEAILWDLAGQPDYRLVHALFVDDADLALVLFDSRDLHDPLHGVEFWLKQLKVGKSHCSILLVAAIADRWSCSLTQEELTAFCRERGISGPITTSAKTNEGVSELIECMRYLIPWEDKGATVTTATFKRIKDYVLGLKEAGADGRAIVTLEVLRDRLEAADAHWRFTDDEMLWALGDLENYGYVKRLRTSKGQERILLEPERLNNLASSFVLEARRNPKGLGALQERRLRSGGYGFPELTDLNDEERDVLLDSAALLFLEHNVCFRETDPLSMKPYLVFPELMNLKKPPGEEQATDDGVAYTVSGPTENVFASLVVLLGYTHSFTRTNQWQNNARYEVGGGWVCGFREEAERDGELDLVLCFGPEVEQPVRMLFQGLFESFLARRNLTVMRYEPVYCSNPDCRQLLERSVVRKRMNESKDFAYCDECGEKLALPKTTEPIQLSGKTQTDVDNQRLVAEQRTRFEQAVFRLRAYVDEQKIQPPACFISYAWGAPDQERWVEKMLAMDLQKAGINVLLDRWHNAQIGASVARFVERIMKSDRVIMVGTPLYHRKYENKEAGTGYVVAAEVDVIANRLLGTEAQKESVLPLLLQGEKSESLPPLLQGRVYADFRDESGYFTTAFDLILSLYRLPPTHPAVADLRESLREPGKPPDEAQAIPQAMLW